jgi:hypothetical protein
MKAAKKGRSMKKAVMGLLFATLIVGGVFAQQAGRPQNWVSGQIGLINGGAGYERTLSSSLGVGGEAYWNSFFVLWNSVAVEAYAKYYPFGGNFYAKLGLGYGTVTGWETVDFGNSTYSWFYSTAGFLVDPGIGWKIDVGNPGSFFIEPKISVPIVLGKKTYDAISAYTDNGEFKVGVNFVVAFGMGYAF